MKKALATFVLALALLVPTSAKRLSPIQSLTYGNQLACTTFSINEQRGVWATAAHCVEDNEGVLVTNRDYRIAGEAASVLMWQHEWDLALLTGAKVERLKLGDRPDVGDSVSVTGFPWGFPSLPTFWGRVASVKAEIPYGDKMLFDMAAAPGNSGSPVVDRDGEVVSVLQDSFQTFSGGCTYKQLVDAFKSFWQR